MIRKFKLFTISAGLALAFAGTFSVPTASAQLFDGAKKEACQGLNTSNDGAPVGGNAQDVCGTGSGNQVGNLLTTVLNILSLVIGVVAVVMIVIAGLKYITSGGDSASVSSAKNTLLYAIIGLVVVVSAQMLVRFVLKRTDTRATPAQTTTSP